MGHKLLTEIYYSGQWNKVDPRDSDPVGITRGQADERSAASPGTASLALFNPDRSYSPRDPRSPLYGLIGQNTPLRHTLLPEHITGPLAHVIDTFQRTVGVGWGTEPTSGHVWSGFTSGTTASSVSPGQGLHSITDTNAYRGQYLGSISTRSVTVGVTFAVEQATGAALEPANIMLRGTTISSYVMARVAVQTDNSITVQAFAAGGASLGPAVTTGLTHAGTGTPLRFEARIVGHRIEVRLWNPTGARPDTPTAVFTDPASVIPGWVGVRSGVATGNTNTKPVIFTYTNFEARCESTRFTGEITAWPPTRDLSGQVITAGIEASGISRRLGAGTKPVRSAYSREATKASSLSTVVGYWPGEDGPDARTIAPGLASHGPMSIHGELTMASFAGFNGSDLLPVLGATGRLKASVPPYPSGATFVHGVYQIPTGFPDLPVLMHLLCTAGSIYRVLLFHETAGGGQLTLYVYNEAGTLLDQTPLMFSDLTGDKLFVSLELVQDASDVDIRVFVWEFDVDGVLAPTGFQVTDTYLGQSIGRVTDLWVGAGAEDMTDLAVGHLMVATNNSLIVPLVSALGGRPGEKAGRRFERLCAEVGVSLSTVGDLDDTETMGPQRSGKLLDLLAQCATADGGIQGEEPDDLGLTYRTRRNLENQTPLLTLDYATGLFAPGFTQAPDDQLIRNDVRVSRPGGSSAQAVLEAGRLSVQAPPAGIGEGYQDDLELIVRWDARLPDQAWWRLHLGTWDEDRYPQIALRLESGRIRSNPALAAALLGLRPGDLIAISNVPDSPDLVLLLVLGFADTLTLATALVGLTAVPGRPYEVGVRDDTTAGRRDTASSVVAEGLMLPGASGDYASTPDHASLDITADIDLRADVTPSTWAPAGLQQMVAKWASAGNLSYQFGLNANGTLRLQWSSDGTANLNVSSTTTPVPHPTSGRLAVRVTMDVNDGAGNRVIRFYTAPDLAGPWTQLGTTITTAGTTSIFAGNSVLEVGSRSGGTTEIFTGVIHAVEVRNGIDATVVANPDFDAQAAGTASFADSTGKTWTVNGAALIVGGFVAGTATSFWVATLTRPLWTTDAAAFPFDIVVEGVRLRVTDIDAAVANVQLVTITQTPVNGVSKTIAAGRPVRLWRAAVRAL